MLQPAGGAAGIFLPFLLFSSFLVFNVVFIGRKSREKFGMCKRGTGKFAGTGRKIWFCKKILLNFAYRLQAMICTIWMKRSFWQD